MLTWRTSRPPRRLAVACCPVPPQSEAEGAQLRHPVVLMHNQPIGNPATVSALPAIIRFFRSHGYMFVAL